MGSRFVRAPDDRCAVLESAAFGFPAISGRGNSWRRRGAEGVLQCAHNLENGRVSRVVGWRHVKGTTTRPRRRRNITAIAGRRRFYRVGCQPAAAVAAPSLIQWHSAVFSVVVDPSSGPVRHVLGVRRSLNRRCVQSSVITTFTRDIEISILFDVTLSVITAGPVPPWLTSNETCGLRRFVWNLFYFLRYESFITNEISRKVLKS